MATVSGPTHDNPRVLNGYQLIKKLGSGLQGKVYSARHTETNELVAVKLLDQDAIRASSKIYLNLQREITAMQRVAGHPHVIGLKSVAFDILKPHKKRSGAKRQIMLVLELAPGGELFSYLMLGKFEEPVARAYFSQLLEALIFAASKGVNHRDLKPENLLLDSKYQLKIADWGLSAVLSDGMSSSSAMMLRTQCGTKSYMAPEILRGELYQGELADTWSAGVLLFIMIAGFPPFQEAVPGDWWYDRCAEGKYALFWAAHERSASFSPAVKDLIQSIFVSQAARRYKLEDCLKHPWTRQDPSTQDEIRAEMGGRRKKITGEAGAGSEAMDEVEAAETAALQQAAANAQAATTAATATLTSAATFDASSNEVSMDGSGGAGAFDFSSDPFAVTVTRGTHDASAAEAAPSVPPMPASRPAFGPKIFLPPVCLASAKLTTTTAAAEEEEGDSSKKDAEPKTFSEFVASFAALADKAGVAIPEDAKPEEAPATAAGEAPAAEMPEAASGDDDSSSLLTSFALPSPSLGADDVSAATVAKALAGFLDASMQATIAIRTAASAGGIKLKASVPTPSGLVRCDVKLLAVRAGSSSSSSSSSSSYLVQVQRTAGDILAFNRAYARLRSAFVSAAALVSKAV